MAQATTVKNDVTRQDGTRPDGTLKEDWDLLSKQWDGVVERAQAMAAPKQKPTPTQPGDDIPTTRLIEMQALKIDADFAEAVKQLQDRRDLTPSGKQQFFAKLESDRQAKVQALQSQAHDLTDTRRISAQAKLEAVKLAEFE